MQALRLSICLLLVVLLLSSCGIVVINHGQKPVTTETETDYPVPSDTYQPSDYPLATETDGEGISEDRLRTLPTKDLGGLTIFIAVSKETGHVFNGEDELYRAAVSRRNEKINKKYNVQIITEYMSAEVLLSEVAKADKAGDYFSDFAVIRGGDFSSYVTKGYLLNLKSLPYTDYSAPYYNQNAMSQLTIDGTMYGAVGDATEQLERYVCLYMNKTYAEALGRTCPYDVVRDGSFTWEYYLTALKELPAEEIDVVSAFSDELTAAMTLFSGGVHFLAANDHDALRLACQNNAAKTMVSFAKTLFSHKTKTLEITVTSPADSTDVTDNAEENETIIQKLTEFSIFEAGHSLYGIGTVGHMEALENAGFSWEILPLPKATEEQPYYTPVTTDAPVIVALASSQNLDAMGYVLQALQAASHGYLVNEFYNDAMQRLITGVNTLDMLDIIRENPFYDLGLFLGEDVKAVKAGTYSAFLSAVKGKKPLSSYLNQKESELNAYLDRLS